MPDVNSFETANAAAERLERAWTAAALADADAVGIAVDDPFEPHVAVAVHDGRIVYIGISDPVAHGDAQELQDVLNGCIFTAFTQWAAQRAGITGER